MYKIPPQIKAKKYLQWIHSDYQKYNCGWKPNPEVTKYVDVESSKIVENPSEEDVKLGKVTLVTDRDATFSPANVKFQYSTKLTPDMVMGQQLIMEIHERNVNSGVAKSIEELKKANELTLVPQDGPAESGN
jgi:hypothetical protein